MPRIAGLKPLAQRMEAFQADERVGFIRLSRNEVVVELVETQGFIPPKQKRAHHSDAPVLLFSKKLPHLRLDQLFLQPKIDQSFHVDSTPVCQFFNIRK